MFAPNSKHRARIAHLKIQSIKAAVEMARLDAAVEGLQQRQDRCTSQISLFAQTKTTVLEGLEVLPLTRCNSVYAYARLLQRFEQRAANTFASQQQELSVMTSALLSAQKKTKYTQELAKQYRVVATKYEVAQREGQQLDELLETCTSKKTIQRTSSPLMRCDR